MSDILSVTEISELLRVSKDTVRNWIADGSLCAININRDGKRPTFRIRRDDFDAFLERREVAPRNLRVVKTRRRKVRREPVPEYVR